VIVVVVVVVVTEAAVVVDVVVRVYLFQFCELTLLTYLLTSYIALYVTGGSSETGPKTSEAVEPEPLVRDESLRKSDNIREWDRGKKTIYGSLLLLSQ